MSQKSKLWSKIRVWSYVAGLLIAAIVGLLTVFGSSPTLGATTVAVLGVLGIIVGLLNIGDDEVQLFLLASIAFVIASSGMAAVFNAIGGKAFLGLGVFMSAIVVFTAPGALVVAFKALYQVAKDD
jgi:xanthosine utilization system XapX-like protein